jgi:putative thiamine transport system substrate-binding protein
VITRRDTFRLAAGAAALHLAGPAFARGKPVAAADWPRILDKARGQTVYFNAWAGDERTNSFIAWAGEEVKQAHGITIEHVRLRDTSEAVTRVVAEKQAGRDSGGSVDLIWINGPNFLAMKSQKLLYGPYVEALPNWAFVDTTRKRSNVVDFTVPVDGLAAPWRMAQVVYVYDSARASRASLPYSTQDMVAWAKANPGRLTHPNVRNFLGSTFLKQALCELAPNPEILDGAADDTVFAATAMPLWAWYDEIRPSLWRQGREFPETGPAQRQLFVDGEIDFYISFDPADAATGIASRQLPPSARVFVLRRGTIGNTSFVAIPYNAAHAEAAMVVSNFLLEPATQARAQDPRNMGNFTVLDLDKVPQDKRALFARPDGVPALPTNAELGTVLPEPHPSWMTRITAEWEKRYVR